MTVSKLTEAAIRVFDDIDSNGQRTAKTRLGMIMTLAGYEEILQKKRFVSRQTPVHDFFKSFSDTRTSPPAVLDSKDDNPYGTVRPQF